MKTNSAHQRTVGRAFLVLGCVCAALLANPRLARGQQAVRATSDVSAFLARVAPTVVKVNCGGGWGTGAFFGDSRHVITSFALVNRSGKLRSLDRATFELQCVGQIEFAKYRRFVLGPALALTLDHIRRREHGDDRTLYETLESKARLRPSLVLGAIEGPLLTRFVVSPYPEMEGRLDLGISFGR